MPLSGKWPAKRRKKIHETCLAMEQGKQGSGEHAARPWRQLRCKVSVASARYPPDCQAWIGSCWHGHLAVHEQRRQQSTAALVMQAISCEVHNPHQTARQGLPPILNTAIMSRMQEFILDFLIVCAMFTVNFPPVQPQIIPSTLACIVGLVWLDWHLVLGTSLSMISGLSAPSARMAIPPASSRPVSSRRRCAIPSRSSP